MTKNALGTPSPWRQRPLEKTGQMEEHSWSQDGNEEMDIWVSVPTSPEGTFAQKDQQKGHSDASGISWGKWSWIFRGFLIGKRAKEGKIKALHFGLRHSELNHDQATFSICDSSPKFSNCLLGRSSPSPQTPHLRPSAELLNHTAQTTLQESSISKHFAVKK